MRKIVSKEEIYLKTYFQYLYEKMFFLDRINIDLTSFPKNDENVENKTVSHESKQIQKSEQRCTYPL